jgi:hypothetical protein
MSETTGFVLFILGIFACGPIVLLFGRRLERKWKREDAALRPYQGGESNG